MSSIVVGEYSGGSQLTQTINRYMQCSLHDEAGQDNSCSLRKSFRDAHFWGDWPSEPLNLQGYGIFRVAHVGIDAQMGDGQLGGFERESHLIAGLGIILEDEVYDASGGIK